MNIAKHAQTVNRRFSAAALTYDASAVVQRKAAADLIHFIPGHIAPESILEIGCGSGQLTGLLRKRWPHAFIHAIDLADKMVDRARSLFPDDANMRFDVADAASFKSDKIFPLVVSNCALHWLHPFDEGMENVLRLVSKPGYFAAALMLHGTLRELHESRRVAAPHKPPQGRLPRNEEIVTTLQGCGMNIDAVHVEECKTTVPSAADILKILRLQGLTGGVVSRAMAPLTRGELQKLTQTYDEQYRESDGVSITHHIGFYLAIKP